MQSRSKRAEAIALLDSGATENFMNQAYAQRLNLPIKRLTEERKLFNVDGTPNRAGNLKHYVDLTTKTGTKLTRLRYFLTDLGENNIILGYPWFASAQPRIDWAKGWIAYDQLPIVLRTDHADQTKFLPRTARLRKARVYAVLTKEERAKIPPQYQDFAKVFSEQE
jgi:hypothetical protein